MAKVIRHILINNTVYINNKFEAVCKKKSRRPRTEAWEHHTSRHKRKISHLVVSFPHKNGMPTSPGSIISVVTLCAALIRHNSSSHAGCNPGRSEFSTYKRCYIWLSCFCSFWTMCWNSPPSALKSSSLQPEQFRRQLKTTVMAQPL